MSTTTLSQPSAPRQAMPAGGDGALEPIDGAAKPHPAMVVPQPWKSRVRGPGPAGPAGRRPGPGHPGHGSAVPATRPHRPAPAAPLPVPAVPPGTRRTAPDPHELVLGFARLYLEVECGRRPAALLGPLMDPVLHARLEAGWVRLHQSLATVRTVHATVRDGRQIDAVVVVQRGERAGALALRLSRLGERWRVTAADRPEDGPLPPPPFSMPPRDEADMFAVACLA